MRQTKNPNKIYKKHLTPTELKTIKIQETVQHKHFK